MDLQLKNKKAFISGSTQGIGFETASVLAREGVDVVINGRSGERVEAAVGKLKEVHPGAVVTGIAADVSTPEDFRRLFESVPEVDILINNTGIFEPKEFEEITDEEWYRFFDINVMSAIRLCRYYFPKMKAKKAGRIVFLSSESAVNIPPEMVQYGMTKTALLAVARGLAEAAKGTEITVNSVLPGPTATEGVNTFLATLAKQEGLSFEEMVKEFFVSGRPNSILGRLIKPEEVASTIAFLCSPLAQATNGAAIRIDGGLIRSPM